MTGNDVLARRGEGQEYRRFDGNRAAFVTPRALLSHMKLAIVAAPSDVHHRMVREIRMPFPRETS